MKTKKPEYSFIKLVEGKYTPIRFSTLLIRAEAIYNHQDPELSNLLSKSGFSWLQNNHLIYTHEMHSDAPAITDFVLRLEHLFGLKYEQDLVILSEQVIYGVGDRLTPLIWKPIPGTENINWMSSKIMKIGNMVWRNKRQL